MAVKIIKDKDGKEHYYQVDGWRKKLAQHIKENWVRIPHKWAQDELSDLNPHEIWVLVVLKSYASPKGLICPSLRTLSATTHFGLKGTWTIIKRLERLHKIKITKEKGKYNSYEILI
jgi:hypothetical protein